MSVVASYLFTCVCAQGSRSIASCLSRYGRSIIIERPSQPTKKDDEDWILQASLPRHWLAICLFARRHKTWGTGSLCSLLDVNPPQQAQKGNQDIR